MEWSLLSSVGVVLVTVFGLIYAYFKNEYKYWSNLKIPYIEPSFPFGNMSKFVLRKKNAYELNHDFYTQGKNNGHKYLGFYVFSRKMFLVIDPDLVKKVLTTDFSNFHDRGIYHDEVNDPLTANLLTLYGEKSKNLRSKFTPTFSSGRLKMMFPILLKIASEMVNVLERERTIEVKDFVARYTTDVIASCAFAIECNSVKNPNAEFRRIGRRAFQDKIADTLKLIVVRSFPSIAKKIKLKLIDTQISSFFLNAFVDAVTYRAQSKVQRPDFLQLLTELMDKENVEEPLTINEAAAQAFLFFLAGFETSASTITFSMYELARNVEIQSNLRQEIVDMLKKNDGQFTYNGIMEMAYMEKVVQETLRKWPAGPILARKCTKDYPLPDSNVMLAKEMTVVIPVYSLHHDPDIYPNPHIFDPERFNSSAMKKKNDYTYLPFGKGPRICIGMRFAMMQIKMCLAMLLKNFEFTINDKTQDPLILAFNPILLNSSDGIWLDVKPINCK